MFGNITSVIEAASNQTSGALLGDIVFFSFRDATTKGTTLVEFAKSVGFPEGAIPKNLDDEQAFQYACRHFRAGREGYEVREVSRTDGVLAWELVLVTHLDEKANQYTHVDTVLFNRATSAVTADNSTHPITTRLLAAISDCRDAVPTELVRKMVVDLFTSKAGIAMGGNTSWFLAATHHDLVVATQRLVESLGDSTMYVLPVHDSPAARGTVAASAREGLEEQINKIREEIQSFDADTRPSTLTRRIETLIELRRRADLFAGIVSMTADDLKAESAKLEAKLEEMVGVRKAK